MASALSRFLGTGLLLRGLLRELAGLRQAIEAQNVLLGRLADHWAPILPPAEEVSLRRDSGLDFLDPVEASLVADYVARCEADLGYFPTEEQILRYLADQKTTSLHARLALREEDLARLGQEDDDSGQRAARRGEY